MIVCQVAVAWIMGAQVGRGGERAMGRVYAVAVVALTCANSAAFGWSWGPLGWVVPLTFAQTQSFLAMLCRFRDAYYACWVTFMTAFIAAFLSETKGVPLEAMASVWANHWYWKRFVPRPRLEQPTKTTTTDESK